MRVEVLVDAGPRNLIPASRGVKVAASIAA
jgi:hypothetical protein